MALPLRVTDRRAPSRAADTAAAGAAGVPRAVWVTLCLGTAAVFANMYSTQAILPQLGRAFQQPPAVTGLTVSVLVLAVAIGALIAGPLSDRLGRKPLMVGVSGLLVIPTVLCALAPNFVALLGARAAQGLLMPGLTSVAIIYIAELFPPARRGTAMGVYVGGQVLGGALSRVASAMLTNWLDWRAALLFFAFTTIAGTLAIARYLPPVAATHRAEQVSMRAGLLLQVHNRRLLALCLTGCSLFFGYIGIFTYLPYYLTGAPFYLPTGSLGLVYLVWFTGLCSPLVGSWSTRFGSRRLLLGSLVLACAGIALTGSSVLVGLIAGLILLTLGQFTALPSINLLVGESAQQSRGAAAALYLSCYYIGGSAGAVVPGLFWMHFGWHGVLLCCCASVLLALAAGTRLLLAGRPR